MDEKQNDLLPMHRLSAEKASEILRLAVQPMTKFRNLCDVRDAAKSKGQTFQWNVYTNISNSQIEEAYAMNLAFDEERELKEILGVGKGEQPKRRL